MEALKLVYVGALSIAVVLMLWRRYWRSFPCFLAYSAAGLAFMLFQDLTKIAPSPWTHWQMVQCTLRVGCCLEIIAALSRGMERFDRITLAACSIGAAGGVLAIAWLTVPGTSVFVVAQTVRHIESGIIAAILIAGISGAFLGAHPLTLSVRHSLLFIALMANQVAVLIRWGGIVRSFSPEFWRPLMARSYAVGGLVFATIAVLAAYAPSGRRGPEDSLPHDGYR